MTRGIPNEPRERMSVEDRPDEMRRERRERRESFEKLDPTLRRFQLPADQLDLSRYVYRAAADDGMRIMELEAQDYEMVHRDGGVDEGARVRYQHGSADGKPIYTYLMRKPKDWAAEDRQKAQIEKVDVLEKGQGLSRRGMASRQSQVAPSDAGPDAYVPK